MAYRAIKSSDGARMRTPVVRPKRPSPKIPGRWKTSAEGRVALCVIRLCAFQLRTPEGDYYTDDVMRTWRLPSQAELTKLVLEILPWLPDWYNEDRHRRALLKGYDGPMEEFNPGDIANRLLHEYRKPHRGCGNSTYGITTEHPESEYQYNKPYGDVWRRRAAYLEAQIQQRRQISQQAASMLGRTN